MSSLSAHRCLTGGRHRHRNQRHNRVFTRFGGYQAGAAALGPAGGADAERISAARVTAGVFESLRVSPVNGRLFTELDDERGAEPVVILAERLWARRFGADPRLLHRRIMVDGTEREVVGILPDAVRFPASDTEVWLPLTLNPAKTDSATFDYQAVGRLRDGVSIEQAPFEPRSIASIRRCPCIARRGFPISSHRRRRRRELVLLLISAASIIALLLGAIGLYGAMAYVVSLRTREIGIRIALGERPVSVGLIVARQGVSVAILGVAVGLAGAIGLARVLGSLLFAVAPFDPLVLALSAALVLALAAAASWMPGRRAAAVDPALALRGE